MKRALVISPYLDTLGGGEKYFVGVAWTLKELGYNVEIAWNNSEILKELSNRYNLDLSSLTVNSKAISVFKTGSLYQKFILERKYDIVFVVSDGSVPLLFGRTNWLHFQVPFRPNPSSKMLNQVKLKFIQAIICNSKFTKKVIDLAYGVESQVIYPPSSQIPSLSKNKTILSVGRFDNLMHSKRQDILVNAFKSLNEASWQLVIMGGVLHGSKEFDKLKRQTEGVSNIKLVKNASFKQLLQAYGQASLYWHAAGYGQDLDRFPQRAEHFGIATVEAMSAGAVPLVFAGGGQTEIVKHDYNGYLWHKPEELVSLTKLLLHNPDKLAKFSTNASKTSKQFSFDIFKTQIRQLSQQ